MKVFADGAMYSKKAEWSNTPEHVVLQVSSPELPAHELIRYSLSTPGVHTAIIGIGQIDDKPQYCQLTQNLIGAQVASGILSKQERKKIETLALNSKGGKTNYFQKPYQDLTAPREVKVEVLNGGKSVITWHTAHAGDAPIDRYEIWRDGVKVANFAHTPQISKSPFVFTDNYSKIVPKQYIVKVVDQKNRIAQTEPLRG